MKLRSAVASAMGGLLLTARSVGGVSLDLTSKDSIKSAASTLARGMMNYYKGNETGNTPGLLPEPYYWWEAGALMGTLVDYWYYTGDDSYNNLVIDAILFQTGPKLDFMPSNQTKTEGNDDQAFWGMTAMSAAEAKFPNPPSDQAQYLALAQAVFNLQASRWDNTSCGGGLKWQIYWFNNGYNYKNSISQGCFFNIAARLGMYTQNATYFEYANKMWNWVTTVGLVSDTYDVYDGSDDNLNCSQLNHIQWTYNAGVFLYGAAVMWNQTTGTEQDKWRSRTAGLINASSVFFTGDSNQVMYEVACEPQMNCNTDQQSFKAYLSRWMAATTKVAPWTSDLVMPYLKSSATAAAQSCVGGTDGVTCGTQWTATGWDKTYGVGQQMCALSVVQANLITSAPGPVGNATGGNSPGNPSAGTGGDTNPVAPTTPITGGDRAGAGILTALILIAVVGGGWWLIS